MNSYVKWIMLKIDLNLWNEKSKLGHLFYEIAKLCFKFLQDRFYAINLYETRLWSSFKWDLHGCENILGHALVVCPGFGS